MQNESECTSCSERDDFYAKLQRRCEQKFDLCSQTQQTFYRLLSALARDGEEKFLRYGREFTEQLFNSIAEITETEPECNIENLPKLLKDAVERIEADAATRPTIPEPNSAEQHIPLRKSPKTLPNLHKTNFPSPPSSPTSSNSSTPESETHPHSARDRRWSLSARKNTVESKSPSPRSTESSPRSFWGKLTSPKRRSKKAHSTREESCSPTKK